MIQKRRLPVISRRYPRSPLEEVIHKADTTVCPECQAPMQTIGKEYVHEELVYAPAKMFKRKHYVEVVKCPECGEYTEKSTNDKTVT